MRRKIPSTAALTAFESAARHQSFTRAAAEQAVTQSAVCRQVAGLEDFLGVKLFRRTKRGITLTEAGASYHAQVRARLDELERDTLALMAQAGSGGTLELGVVPTFGTKWLLPRLAAFVKAHPGVNVNLAPRTRPFLFDETPLDAAIYAGDPAWPGTESHFLMREHLVAVAGPALIAPQHTLEPAALRHHVLLQQTTRPYAWRHWFAAQQLQVDNDMVGPRMELFSMLTEAAIQGLGVALIPRFLIEDELAAGRLIEVAPQAYLSDRAYCLIYPERKSENATLAVFRDWLIEEARRYRGAAGQD